MDPGLGGGQLFLGAQSCVYLTWTWKRTAYFQYLVVCRGTWTSLIGWLVVRFLNLDSEADNFFRVSSRVRNNLDFGRTVRPESRIHRRHDLLYPFECRAILAVRSELAVLYVQAPGLRLAWAQVRRRPGHDSLVTQDRDVIGERHSIVCDVIVSYSRLHPSK